MIILRLVHFIVLWILEFTPNPEFFIYPYLTQQGWLPYSQILDHHYPGLFFLPINFATLGFTTPLDFKLLLILVVLLQSFLVYRLAKSLKLSSSLSKLSVLFYTVWQPYFAGGNLWIDQFLPLFSLSGLILALSNHWFLSGLLFGLGVVFKQTFLPYPFLVIAYLIFTKRFIPAFKFAVAVLMPLFVVGYYLFHLGVWSQFWYLTWEFSLHSYIAQAAKAPQLNQLILILPLVVVLIAGILSALSSRQDRFAWATLLLFIVAGLFGSFNRFELVHLQPAVPFLSIFSALTFFHLQKRLFSPHLAKVVLGIGLILGMVITFRSQRMFHTAYFDSSSINLASYLSSQVPRNTHILLLGVQPLIYPLSHTFPPSHTFVFSVPWLLTPNQDRLISDLESEVISLIVIDSKSRVDGISIYSSASNLIEYIKSHYQLSDQVGDYQIYLSVPQK